MMVVGVKMESLTIKILRIYQKKASLSNFMGYYGALAAGQINSSEVEKGLRYLTNKETKFHEDHFTAVGFPKFFT